MEGKIKKAAQAIGAETLEKINRYTRRPYKAEELYTFSVVLCDNEVDRDFECFTTKALEKLAELFVGKTGILDHDPSSRNQSARIFETEVKRFPDKKTELGAQYAQLVARAYIPRGKETDALIESIESGIRKEVSVGCAVKKRICSVCGAETCGHLRGKSYGGKRCVRMLDEPTDAYEFSFVAVPAQRAAGVVKQFRQKGEVKTMYDILKRLGEGAESVTISGEELEAVKTELKALEDRALCGDRYRASLTEKIKRLSAVTQPEFKRGLVESIVKGLSTEELEEMAGALGRMAEERLPVMPQLAAVNEERETADDRAFRI